MTEKLVPIEKHKENDLRLIRKKLLETIKSNEATAKDITDASKLLARMHKALAPEKVTAKVSAKEEQAQQELTEKEKEVIRKALA